MNPSRLDRTKSPEWSLITELIQTQDGKIKLRAWGIQQGKPRSLEQILD